MKISFSFFWHFLISNFVKFYFFYYIITFDLLSKRFVNIKLFLIIS